MIVSPTRSNSGDGLKIKGESSEVSQIRMSLEGVTKRPASHRMSKVPRKSSR